MAAGEYDMYWVCFGFGVYAMTRLSMCIYSTTLQVQPSKVDAITGRGIASKSMQRRGDGPRAHTHTLAQEVHDIT